VEINLTQAEADSLIAMPKIRQDNKPYSYPSLGGSISIPLTSTDKREQFLLDISHGQINLLKEKYQNRAKECFVLVRLDFGGSPHRNPDGTEVPCPHLHVYREGFGDKWANLVPLDKFPETNDTWLLFQNFMAYCNITQPPVIQRGLQK
jgi:hypothetical protein